MYPSFNTLQSNETVPESKKSKGLCEKKGHQDGLKLDKSVEWHSACGSLREVEAKFNLIVPTERKT